MYKSLSVTWLGTQYPTALQWSGRHVIRAEPMMFSALNSQLLSDSKTDRLPFCFPVRQQLTVYEVVEICCWIWCETGRRGLMWWNSHQHWWGHPQPHRVVGGWRLQQWAQSYCYWIWVRWLFSQFFCHGCIWPETVVGNWQDGEVQRWSWVPSV